MIDDLQESCGVPARGTGLVVQSAPGPTAPGAPAPPDVCSQPEPKPARGSSRESKSSCYVFHFKHLVQNSDLILTKNQGVGKAPFVPRPGLLFPQSVLSDVFYCVSFSLNRLL